MYISWIKHKLYSFTIQQFHFALFYYLYSIELYRICRAQVCQDKQVPRQIAWPKRSTNRETAKPAQIQRLRTKRTMMINRERTSAISFKGSAIHSQQLGENLPIYQPPTPRTTTQRASSLHAIVGAELSSRSPQRNVYTYKPHRENCANEHIFYIRTLYGEACK